MCTDTSGGDPQSSYEIYNVFYMLLNLVFIRNYYIAFRIILP